MNQGIWKIYKSKVLKSFTAEEEEEEIKEQNNDTVMDMSTEEGSSPVSLLAKKVQGASAKGWKCMSSLFNKDDEHKLLPAENTTPVEHVLSEPAPKEPRPERKLTGFWDVFATRWNQVSEGSDGTDASSGEGEAASATHSEGGGMDNSCSSGQYTNLEEPSDPGFKWSFVTSKLAELKNKSMQKSN
ncbi:uncharacterized protein C1orf232 [Pristis pectinata]|uniref:uncharacterized protein C1orf232 n=1 Tax=Pristis pectinata TaxID=685728 RepID=UPI00223D2AA2|nr:uncharacterized protein C1orf232 [Pristis pectinata]